MPNVKFFRIVIFTIASISLMDAGRFVQSQDDVAADPSAKIKKIDVVVEPIEK